MKRIIAFSVAVLCMTSCSEDNTSTLPALSQPGELCVVHQCVVNNYLKPLSEEECIQAGGAWGSMVFAANMDTASIAYIPYYSRSRDFDTIDITTSVPGVTAIATGERPQSMATDDLGAFIIISSAAGDEISVLSVNQHREIAYQKLDKKPIKVSYRKEDQAFHVFFADGTVRSLSLEFQCPGEEVHQMTSKCTLEKSDILLTWKNLYQLDGTVVDYVADPVRTVGYVSYFDRKYISVIGYSEDDGTCLDGAAAYPCEIERLGAGFGCSDGIDNDGNGQIDAQDPSCFYPWSAEGSTTDAENPKIGWAGPGGCSDFLDNNENGFIDALDPGCVSSNDASEEPGFQPMTMGTCGDGTDNDGDGDADRDDLKCRWPVDNESASSLSTSLSVGMCRDGLDNDGDGLIDSEDLACYGSNGLSEVMMTSTGRGRMDVDPLGRFLYVLDPEESQLIVIDLETRRTIDRSGWFPRQRVVGIPVARLALDIVADSRQETLYNKNGRTVESERAVVFVSSSSGVMTEYSILENYSLKVDGELKEQRKLLAMRATDTDDDESYIGAVRCVGRICTETDLPTVELRHRPAIRYFSDVGTLTDTHPITGEPLGVVYDAIIASETWRVTYEGTLERDERHDGHFVAEGEFRTNMDLCALGAIPGDHLILRNRKGLANLSAPQCLPFAESDSGVTPNLEWRITDVGPHRITVEPTGLDTDVSAAPNADCFANGLEFEIRASNQWLITSRSTYVNRRITAGDHCVDNPLNPFGQTRFSFDPATPGDTDRDIHAQTAFFGVKMPSISMKYARDDAFEFTTRTGMSSLSIGVGSAPTAMKLFKSEGAHFLLISEASADAIIVYDVDDEGIDDTL